jgi:PKD repeat protein
MNRRLRGGISAAVCALALAGCGGGGGDGSTAIPTSQAQNNAVQPGKAAAPKIADMGVTPTSALRPGTKVSFIVSGVFPSATTYAWDFGDSTPLSNGVSATHTYSKVGTFSVKVTATDASGQKSVKTSSVVIVQNQPPTVSGAVTIGQIDSSGVFNTGIESTGAINIGQTGTVGQTVNIVVNATDPQGDSLTYRWLIDGVAYGATTASNILRYTFTYSGAHVLTVTVMDEYGGQTSRDFPVTLVSQLSPVNPLPPVNPEPGGYALWKASYAAQPVGRVRVAANKIAWALPTKKAQVLRSADNGRSWQELTLPKGEEGAEGNLALGFTDIGFADDKNIWVVGYPQPKYFKTGEKTWLDFDYAAVMHSSDGGSSWENVKIRDAGEDRIQQAIQFVGQNGWIVDTHGTVMKTTDGGKTWHLQAETGIGAIRMQFIDASNGWIVGSVGVGRKMTIARTTDGGATWTA